MANKVMMIAAMSPGRIIGVNNGIPWKCRTDMQHFREKTLGRNIVMGRKTWESIGCVPLKGRQNYVLTSQTFRTTSSVRLIRSVGEVLEQVKDPVIIGGASLYEQFLEYTEEMYLTEIHSLFGISPNDKTTIFPDFPYTMWEWDLIDQDRECDIFHLTRMHSGMGAQ